MKRLPVTSSQIAALGHDPINLKMQVEFKSFKPDKPTSVYEFSNVSQEDFAALMNAESIGKTFNAGIKANPTKYPFRKLTTEEAAQ